MKDQNSVSSPQVVSHLFRNLGMSSPLMNQAEELEQAEKYLSGAIVEQQLPQDLIEFRENLASLHEQTGRYRSLMNEIRYLLRVS